MRYPFRIPNPSSDLASSPESRIPLPHPASGRISPLISSLQPASVSSLPADCAPRHWPFLALPLDTFTVALALLIAAACSGGGTTTPPGNTAVLTSLVISALGNTLAIADITVGGTVQFVFPSQAHNVFFDNVAGKPADIPGEVSNQTVARAFTTKGTFGYRCTLHPEMIATVVVH